MSCVASTDGDMLAFEATKILQHLAHITAEKQQKLYSAIVKTLRLHIAIASAETAHHCLRGSGRSSTKQPPTTFRTKS
jgi:hypothetical protein